ncbi:MAG: site-specific integrase, partial [Alphaproteobacteria bacterium]
MATIRKRDDKYQVQIRRIGQAPVSRTFERKKDAQTWARQMELKADRYDLPPDQKPLERALGDLVER